MIPYKISKCSACVALALSTLLAGAAHADQMIGNLSVTGTDFDFGSRVVGSTSFAQTVFVTNMSNTPVGPMQVSAATVPNFGLVANGCNNFTMTTIGESCSILYTFTPTALGAAFSSGLTINIDGTPVLVNFTGTGTVNQAPIAANDSYTTPAGATLVVPTNIGVLGNDRDADGDAIATSLVSQSTNGTVTTFNADGSFTYTPNAGFSGTDSFTYTVNDGILDSAPATVTIAVGGVPNTTPNAFSFTTQAGAGLNSIATSGTVTVAGINTTVPITISGGTYSRNNGAYTANAGTVQNGDTITINLQAAAVYNGTTTATLTVGGVSAPFSVTTLVAPGLPPPIPSATSPVPALTLPPFCGLNTPLTISNLTTGQGSAFALDMVKMLSSAVAQSLTFVEQSDCGTVTLAGYNGGKLALVPLAFNTSDARPNGIYAVGNGQYQVVRNNQSLVIAPALAHVEQLTGMLQGAAAKRLESGVMTATVNGLTYVVQPGVAVQADKPAAGGQLAMGKDGFFHFTDALGNNQVLYPAFADPTALRSLLQGMDHAASLNVQLDGTAAIVLNGKPYTLVPDMTLTKTPADRVGQNWWQESAARYWVINSQTFGTVQGYTLKP